mmetsp:Transcript_13390/g.52425  ORF Transcript_13390/g.52425 Transcript_13390/m.52425 type:complete len:204 (+) Transcript_13390:492-1103(+)
MGRRRRRGRMGRRLGRDRVRTVGGGRGLRVGSNARRRRSREPVLRRAILPDAPHPADSRRVRHASRGSRRVRRRRAPRRLPRRRLAPSIAVSDFAVPRRRRRRGRSARAGPARRRRPRQPAVRDGRAHGRETRVLRAGTDVEGGGAGDGGCGGSRGWRASPAGGNRGARAGGQDGGHAHAGGARRGIPTPRGDDGQGVPGFRV